MPYPQIFTFLANNVESIVIKGGYIIVFLFSFLEGIPLVGMIIPGQIAIITAAFLAKIGTFSIYYVVILSILGSVLGDFGGYFLGRKFGMKFIDRLRPYFLIRQDHIEKAKKLIHNHTGKAMIFGRFSPVTRAIVPFLVGTSSTKVSKFWFYNIIGGVSWAVTSILIGYILGYSYHTLSHYLGKFVLLAIIIGVLIVWAYRFINARFHIFARYELFTLGLGLISLWSLSECFEDAMARYPSMASFDVWVNSHMVSLSVSHHYLIVISHWISLLGGVISLSIIGGVVGLIYLFKKKWRSAGIVIISLVSTALAGGILKDIFLRARPANAVEILVNNPSFPSVHAAMAAAFFVVMAYLLAPRIKSWIRREFLIVGAVFISALVGLSRIILNVHWVSDVIAGWSLGIFLACSSILFVRYASILLLERYGFEKKGR